MDSFDAPSISVSKTKSCAGTVSTSDRDRLIGFNSNGDLQKLKSENNAKIQQLVFSIINLGQLNDDLKGKLVDCNLQIENLLEEDSSRVKSLKLKIENQGLSLTELERQNKSMRSSEITFSEQIANQRESLKSSMQANQEAMMYAESAKHEALEKLKIRIRELGALLADQKDEFNEKCNE